MPELSSAKHCAEVSVAVLSNCHQREFAEAGGLVDYAPDFADDYRQGGIYAGKILKGARPGELPVMQASKFELVINLKTARTLGLTIPAGVLSIADEVIE